MNSQGYRYTILLMGLLLLPFHIHAEEAPAGNSDSIAEEVTAEEVMTAEEMATDEQEYEMTDEEAEYWANAEAAWESLTPRTGGITLGQGLASLNVPQQFHYFSPQDARVILEDLWGNPPDEVDSLGLLMPAGYTAFDDESWAVTIDYEESGHISEDDADDLDYDEMLKTMQEDTAAWNEERMEQGYDPIELVGWASKPFYDKSAHKAYWAKELKFGDAEMNTLNYNVRILGREGVLVLNFIANMDQKDTIDSNVNTVLNMANFSPGNQYGDFDPSTDAEAGYGIGGMVSGDPNYMAELGLVAMAILLLKKFGVYILAGIAAVGAWLFKSRKNPDAID